MTTSFVYAMGVTGLNNFFNPRRVNSLTAHWVVEKVLKSPVLSKVV
jgi:hypothetical protein